MIFTLGLGLLVVWIPVIIITAWLIYRVVRGWLALNDRRLMPV